MTKYEVAKQLQKRGVTGANNYAHKDVFSVEQLVDMFFDIMDLELSKKSSIHDACISYEGNDK